MTDTQESPTSVGKDDWLDRLRTAAIDFLLLRNKSYNILVKGSPTASGLKPMLEICNHLFSEMAAACVGSSVTISGTELRGPAHRSLLRSSSLKLFQVSQIGDSSEILFDDVVGVKGISMQPSEISSILNIIIKSFLLRNCLAQPPSSPVTLLTSSSLTLTPTVSPRTDHHHLLISLAFRSVNLNVILVQQREAELDLELCTSSLSRLFRAVVLNGCQGQVISSDMEISDISVDPLSSPPEIDWRGKFRL